MKNRLTILGATIALVVAGTAPVAAQDGDVTISLGRFFGDCDDATQGVTDVKQATSECEVIQILTNAFNAADNGIIVEKVGGQAWGDYYPQLSTTFAAGTPPDVAVMHDYWLPDFASRGLLMPLDEMLADAGVDLSDYVPSAQAVATYEDEFFGVPFDIHSQLWHMNVDLLEEAGLTDEGGNPVVPTSADDLIAQCQQFQETTGKQFFAHDWFEFGVGARLFMTLVFQQGSDLYDGSTATVDTPEGQEALRLLNEIAANCSDPAQGYTDSQQSFLNGDVAVLHNGTWVVDQYDRETEFGYIATDIPNLYGTPKAWGSSHMWVMPQQPDEDPAKTAASVEFLKFLYESVADWAIGTGHIGPRVSVIASDEYTNAPQRVNYAGTADIAAFVPAVRGWAGAWDALAEELNATWITGKDQAQALADAEARMNEEIN